MRGGDGEWQIVYRKGTRRSNRVGNAVHRSTPVATDSFYVANFPGYFSVKDLWTLCSKHGRVSDVYIGQKL